MWSGASGETERIHSVLVMLQGAGRESQTIIALTTEPGNLATGENNSPCEETRQKERGREKEEERGREWKMKKTGEWKD